MEKGSTEYYKLADRIADLIEAFELADPLEVPDLEFVNEMIDKEINRNLNLRKRCCPRDPC